MSSSSVQLCARSGASAGGAAPSGLTLLLHVHRDSDSAAFSCCRVCLPGGSCWGMFWLPRWDDATTERQSGRGCPLISSEADAGWS